MDSEPDPEPDSIILQPITNHDQEILHRLLKNPKIAKNGAKGSAYLDQEINEICNQFVNFWERFNLGMHTVYLDGQIAGIAGFAFSPEVQKIELMYFLDEPFWGKGWASKIAHILQEKAFKEFKLDTFVGFVEENNAASIKILKKIGMNEQSSWEKNGQKFIIYEASNPEPVIHRDFLFENINL